MSGNNPCEVTYNTFVSKLNERVSDYNTKLVIQSVKIGTGIREEDDTPLNIEDVRSICLELIKKGGPAFQVGKDIYNTLQ